MRTFAKTILQISKTGILQISEIGGCISVSKMLADRFSVAVPAATALLRPLPSTLASLRVSCSASWLSARHASGHKSGGPFVAWHASLAAAQAPAAAGLAACSWPGGAAVPPLL